MRVSDLYPGIGVYYRDNSRTHKEGVVTTIGSDGYHTIFWKKTNNAGTFSGLDRVHSRSIIRENGELSLNPRPNRMTARLLAKYQADAQVLEDGRRQQEQRLEMVRELRSSLIREIEQENRDEAQRVSVLLGVDSGVTANTTYGGSGGPATYKSMWEEMITAFDKGATLDILAQMSNDPLRGVNGAFPAIVIRADIFHTQIMPLIVNAYSLLPTNDDSLS